MGFLCSFYGMQYSCLAGVHGACAHVIIGSRMKGKKGGESPLLVPWDEFGGARPEHLGEFAAGLPASVCA